MGIYLPNIEMPRKGEMLVIFPDGTSYVCFNGMRERLKHTTAFSVPPHGRLGDLDAAAELAMQYCPDDDGACSKSGADLRELLDEIENLPTIIPAEEET